MGMLRYRGSGWMVQTVLGVVKVTDKSQAGIAVNVVQQQNDAVATASSFCSTVTSMKKQDGDSIGSTGTLLDFCPCCCSTSKSPAHALDH